MGGEWGRGGHEGTQLLLTTSAPRSLGQDLAVPEGRHLPREQARAGTVRGAHFCLLAWIANYRAETQDRRLAHLQSSFRAVKPSSWALWPPFIKTAHLETRLDKMLPRGSLGRCPQAVG